MPDIPVPRIEAEPMPRREKAITYSIYGVTPQNVIAWLERLRARVYMVGGVGDVAFGEDIRPLHMWLYVAQRPGANHSVVHGSVESVVRRYVAAELGVAPDAVPVMAVAFKGAAG